MMKKRPGVWVLLDPYKSSAASENFDAADQFYRQKQDVLRDTPWRQDEISAPAVHARKG